MELPRRTQRGSKSISSRKSSNKSRSFYAVSVKLSKSTVYNPTLTVSKLMLQLRLLINYFTLELINSMWTLNKGYQYRLAHPCVLWFSIWHCLLGKNVRVLLLCLSVLWLALNPQQQLSWCIRSSVSTKLARSFRLVDMLPSIEFVFSFNIPQTVSAYK